MFSTSARSSLNFISAATWEQRRNTKKWEKGKNSIVNDKHWEKLAGYENKYK